MCTESEPFLKFFWVVISRLFGNIFHFGISKLIVNIGLGVQQGVENTEKIELPSPNDQILAATVYSKIPIFFSRLNGFVSISSSDFGNFDGLNR